MKSTCIVLLTAAASIGCSSTTTPSAPEAWLIRPPATGNAVVAPPNAPVLRIASTETASHLRGLVVTAKDGRIRTFVGHEFAAPIGSMIEDALRASLVNSGRYRFVLSSTAVGRSDLSARLRVNRFEIAESEGGWEAVVSLGLTIENDERKVLATPTISGTSRCDGESPGAFVAALERALGNALELAPNAMTP